MNVFLNCNKRHDMGVVDSSIFCWPLYDLICQMRLDDFVSVESCAHNSFKKEIMISIQLSPVGVGVVTPFY
jgi:hypothetical protein